MQTKHPMKRRVFRALSLLLAVTLLAVGVPMMAHGLDSLDTVFPDAAILAKVITLLDGALGGPYDGTEDYDTAEAAVIAGETTLELSGLTITDLTGLAEFTSLTSLDLTGVTLTGGVLDAALLPATLTSLICDGMGLTAVANVDMHLTALQTLDLKGNDLTSLSLSGMTALTDLDLSGNTSLATLNLASDTALATLNLASDTVLATLTLTDLTAMTVLDVSGLANLETLTLDLANLDDLNCSGCTKLGVAGLDLSGVPLLTILNCASCGLTDLDLSGVPDLLDLNCAGNFLETLDLSGVPALTDLNCSNNNLTELSVAANTALTTVNIEQNYLSTVTYDGAPTDVVNQKTYIPVQQIFAEIDESGGPVVQPVSVGTPITLQALVTPPTAILAANLKWELVSGSATLTPDGGSCEVNGLANGTVTVRAYIEKASATRTTVYSDPITIDFSYKAITSIQVFDTSTDLYSDGPFNGATPGKNFYLDAFEVAGPPVVTYGVPVEILPLDAAAIGNPIQWSIVSSSPVGAAVNADGMVYGVATPNTATVVVRATIVNGVGIGTNYTKDFTINYEFLPILEAMINDDKWVANGATANPGGTYVAGKTVDLVLTARNDTAHAVPSSFGNDPAEGHTWSLVGAVTGVTLSTGGKLTVDAGVTADIKVEVRVPNGPAWGTPGTYTFVLKPSFMKVQQVLFTGPPTMDLGDTVTLSGTVVSVDTAVPPANASFLDIIWEEDSGNPNQGSNLSGTGSSSFTPTAPGTYKFQARIVNGLSNASPGTDYVSGFVFTISVTPTNIVDIIDLPTVCGPGELITLAGTVDPGNASYANIPECWDWSFVSSTPSGLGYTLNGINGADFTPASAGKYMLRIEINTKADGTGSVFFTKDFEILVQNIPVTDLAAVNTGVGPKPAGLSQIGVQVVPSTATMKATSIVWKLISVGSGVTIELLSNPGVTVPIGTTIAGTANQFVAAITGSTGSYVIEARIAGGGDEDGLTDFAKQYTITVANVGVIAINVDIPGPYEVANGANLTLVTEVDPSNAANKTITWSAYNILTGPSTSFPVNAGSSPMKVTSTAIPPNKATNVFVCDTAGVYYVTATIVNGTSNGLGGWIDTKVDYVVTVKNNPVTSFTWATALSLGLTAPQTSYALTGTILPDSGASEATAHRLGYAPKFSIINPGTTGAVVSGANQDRLSVSQAGEIIMRVSIQGGLANGNVWTSTDGTTGGIYDYKIKVLNTPVTGVYAAGEGPGVVNMTGPTYTLTAQDTVGITLPSTGLPTSATNKAVTWSISSQNGTGPALSGNKVTVNSRGTGTLVLKATVKNGNADGTDWTQLYAFPVVNKAVTNVTAFGGNFSTTVNTAYTLRGTIVPSDATVKAITWSMVTSTVDAKIVDGVFTATKAGTYYVNATIFKGRADGTDFIYTTHAVPSNPQGLAVVVAPVIVTGISGVVTSAYTGDDVKLGATPVKVAPNTASFGLTDIIWAVAVDNGSPPASLTYGTTGISGNGTTSCKYVPANPGKYVLRATIVGGAGGTPIPADYVQYFPLEVINIGVQKLTLQNNLTSIPTGNTNLGSIAVIEPSNASKQTITWTVIDPPGPQTDFTFAGGVITANLEQQIKVRATIVGGMADGSDFVADFTLNVSDSKIVAIADAPTALTTGTPLVLSNTIDPSTVTTDVQWSVWDAGTTGATVTKDGSVYTLNALRPGTVRLLATVPGGNEDGSDWVSFYDVEVKGPVIKPGDLPEGGENGETVILSGATVYVRKYISVALNAPGVKYSSNGTKYATVDPNTGVVLGKRPGTVVIYMQVDGKNYQKTVTVKYNFWQWLLVIFLFGWIWVPLK